MDDPLVGGYSNAQVALRRAIAMGFNVDELIRVLYAGNALPANQLLPPGVNGHDTSLPPKSLYDPAAARALLDRFGFKDVDGDGFRETPDGKPLTVVRGTLPESWYREADTLWRKNMDAIGIRMQVNQQTFAELLNLSRAGKLPMFNLGIRSLEPSGYQILQTLCGKETLDTNPSGFKRAEYDAAYEEFLRTPGRCRAHRVRAQDVGTLPSLDADDPAHLCDRQCSLLPVGAGLLAVAIRRVLEIRRHRPREAQAGSARRSDLALQSGRRDSYSRRCRPVGTVRRHANEGGLHEDAPEVCRPADGTRVCRRHRFCIGAIAGRRQCRRRNAPSSPPMAATRAPPARSRRPCRSFNVAIGNTNPGGEVVILDTAGYGVMTINKSIKIIGPSGVYGGISVLGGANPTTGIVINAGDTDDITLAWPRHLRRARRAWRPFPLFGIDIQNAGAVHIEKSSIGNFPAGWRRLHPARYGKTVRVYIDDSFLRDCRVGVYAQRQCRVRRAPSLVDPNRQHPHRTNALNAVASGTSGLVLTGNFTVALRNSIIAGAGDRIFASNSIATASSRAYVIGSPITRSGNAAIKTRGTFGSVSLIRSQVNNCTIAVDHGAGVVRLDGNHIVKCADGFVNNGSPNIVSNGLNMVYDIDNLSGFSYITPMVVQLQ